MDEHTPGRPATDANQATRDYGCMPLFMASYNGRLEVVTVLLKVEEVDANQAMTDGQSPLFAACESGRTEIAVLLIGADACS